MTVASAVKLLRAQRRTCQHVWQKRRGGTEMCQVCGDHFPCRSFKCEHVDCISRAIKLGRRTFPRSFSFSVVVLNDGHDSYGDCVACVTDVVHTWLEVDTGLPPERWVLPRGWKLEPR